MRACHESDHELFMRIDTRVIENWGQMLIVTITIIGHSVTFNIGPLFSG